MAEQLSTATDFVIALKEVDLLLKEADNAASDGVSANAEKFAVMVKSAVLLLAGKFEAFLEGAAEDFLFAINQVGAKAHLLPPRLLAEHTVDAIGEVEKQLSKGDLSSIRSTFVSLAHYWIDLEPCSELSIECKFNYGKHGEAEVNRLFKRIGVENVFKQVLVPDDVAEPYEGSQPLANVKGVVNSLTQIRNNILHQDATPNLSTGYVREQSDVLQRFAMALITELQSIVDHTEEKASAEFGPII